MKSYSHVARLVFERPWAILPQAFATIVEVVRLRAAGTPLSDDDIRERLAAAPQRQKRGTQGAVAVIPIQGVIIPKADLMAEMSGATSVTAITAAIREAVADPEIGSIVLDIDSPGGMVEGITELAAELRAARTKKPIVAVADHMAASAAYWIASQADELVATPSSVVGSIGVYMTHFNEAGAFAKLGIEPTVVSAGKFKTETLPYAALTDEGREHLQAWVDDAYSMFVGDVAKGRKVPVGKVKGGYGEGSVLTASAALAEGMVDRIDTLDATIVRAAQGKIGPRSETSLVGPQAVIEPDPEPIPEPPKDPEPVPTSHELEVRKLRARQHSRILTS